ncbi:F-box protein [Aspergillus lucknowensis]|uniref:F-box domain-containing protein n=1 Tax=Aspergillus lucknowensis TaxID=176173 RepID=A0ABR4LNL6_9EURO
MCSIRLFRPKYKLPIHHRRPDPILLRLPVELLEAVLSNLLPVDLSRASRACRQLHLVAVQLLFKTVVLRTPQVIPFICALDSNRELSRYVQSLTMHDHHLQLRDNIEAYKHYSDRISQTIARLTNLRSLTIKACYHQQRPWTHPPSQLPRVLDETAVLKTLFLPALHSPFLASLRSCQLNLSDSETWELGDRECILLHPNLKSLSILGALILAFDSFTEDHRHTTPLTELTLLCCDLSPEVLAKILAVPKKLQKFTFIGAPQGIAWGKRTSDHHERYIDAMKLQAPSLVALNISFWNRRYSHNPPVDFLCFPVLEDLTISPGVLQGNGEHFHDLIPLTSNPFPPSLKHLTLYDVRYLFTLTLETTYVSLLSWWVAERSLPNLTTLTFANPHDYGIPSEPPSGWEAFQGKVAVQRREFIKLRRFPIDCECCEFNMGSWTLGFGH